MAKEKKKFLRRNAGWIAMRIFTYLNGITPLGWNYFLGSVLGSIAYLVVRRHRKIALEGLELAFPEKTVKQRKKIARQVFIFMAQSSFELLHCLKNIHQLKNISIEGEEYLRQALAKKKGVIIVTAHLGNFPLMSLKLAKAGYPVSFVTRPMRDEKTSDYIHGLRSATGVKTIFSYPRRECVNGIIKALANNEIVVMQMDQNFGTGGVWVKFFGQLAATPVGPIVLALRTQSAVVPAYIYRQTTGKHCIKISSEQQLDVAKEKDETVLANAIELTRIIEAWVREHDFQWSWIHRRWKSRPSKEVERLKFKIEQ
ncbi:MAG: lysophospholipid acyltransferase family protein [Candidatus Omnitrophica bacterium]|nr:lysophospholipid acyltransferase family protein [Candidatus Omnitrophota bacterium]